MDVVSYSLPSNILLPLDIILVPYHHYYHLEQ